MDQSDQEKVNETSDITTEKRKDHEHVIEGNEAEAQEPVSKKLDPVGEAQVRLLAKTSARRSLNLNGQKETQNGAGHSNTPAKPAIPVEKVGWVEVPGHFLLEWNANPWKARPLKLAILALAYACLYLLVLWFTPGDVALMIIVPIILLSSASSHFLPSKYIITEEGIYWKNYLNMVFKSWLEIEDFVFENDMGELFYDAKSIRNRIQRGIPVYYNNNQAEVEDLVRRMHSAKWDQLRDEVRQRNEKAQAAERRDAASEERKAKRKKDERTVKEGDHVQG